MSVDSLSNRNRTPLNKINLIVAFNVVVIYFFYVQTYLFRLTFERQG